MITLSFGFLKPENTDTGDVFFPAMETNIQKMNDHTHDGTNSAMVAKTREQITSGQWQTSPVPVALYYFDGTIPSGLTFDTTVMIFTDVATGSVVPLDLQKTSDTTYSVYTNNPTDYWVLFL